MSARVLSALLLIPLSGCPIPVEPPIPESAPGEGSIIITEIMVTPTDCGAEDGQWLEIFNASDAEIDLDEIELSNGETTVQLESFDLEPGATAVGVSTGASPCHGFLPDFRYPPLVWDADRTAVELSSTEGLVDAIDLKEWWIPSARSLALNPVAQTATANDVRANWCAGFNPISASDFGSPGDPNPNCPEDSDTGDTEDTDLGLPLTLEELEVGDLIITEVHIEPIACGPETGQFVEIQNVSGRAVELDGLLLSDGINTAPVTPALSLAAGERAYFTIGSLTESCWIAGALPDGAWGSELQLTAGSTVSVGRDALFQALDSVDLSTLQFTRGVAMQLSDSASTADANDVAENWCMSRENIVADQAAIPDLGSPGRDNRTCPPVVVITDPKLGSELVAGDLIITEMMVDPDECPDFNAQYFEVFNASGEAVDLMGMSIQIQSGRVTELTQSYPVAAGAWALAEYQSGAAIATCYTGLLNDFLWTNNRLLNDGSMITLFNDIGIIDTVDLRDLATIPGAALSLDVSQVDAIANDDPYNWCHSERLFTNSFGDKGTPRAPNELCLTHLTDAPLPTPAP